MDLRYLVNPTLRFDNFVNVIKKMVGGGGGGGIKKSSQNAERNCLKTEGQ